MEGEKSKMVDTTQAMESTYLTADLVDKSPTKKLVVINPGDYEDTMYGKRLTLTVNIDGNEKKWRPNRESVENLQPLGVDSLDWVGKVIYVIVEKRNNKDSIIARPKPKQPEPGDPDY